MASKNRLLGSGIEYGEEEKKTIAAFDVPCFMYSESNLSGILVKTTAQLKTLKEQGYVDHPGKCARLPGHEKLYDEFHKEPEKKETEEELETKTPPDVDDIEPTVPGMKISKKK